MGGCDVSRFPAGGKRERERERWAMTIERERRGTVEAALSHGTRHLAGPPLM